MIISIQAECSEINYFKNNSKSDNIIASVPYFPERRVYLLPDNNQFKKRLYQFIANDYKTRGVKFFIGKPSDPSDYYLTLNYALGCPNLGQSTDCRILLLWDMYRGDHSPVTGWRAFYPIDIPLQYHQTRHAGFTIPDSMIILAGNDFIKSLNYETLKNETEDKVFIQPDSLTDNTTLCSQDSLNKYYSNAGLYITDKAYKARFFISTTLLLSPTFKTTKEIIVQRLILDRITGEHKKIPFKAVLDAPVMNEKTYDCISSANSTIKVIGEFIANAP